MHSQTVSNYIENLTPFNMDSIKSYTFIVLIVLMYSACQTKSKEITHLDEVKPTIIEKMQKVKEPDSTDYTTEIEHDDTTNIANKVEQQKRKEKTHVIDIIDVIQVGDVWLGDPFEDPDYIGTPCEEDENGNCIRHNHHKNEPDSLNHIWD